MSTDREGANLDQDPRWQHLIDRAWVCRSCGKTHSGIFDITYSHPSLWDGADECTPNSELGASTHFLAEDFCVINNEHFFVRCVLLLPVSGSGGRWFGFGVWSSLSKTNFKHYAKGFNTSEYEDPGPWFGWFSNQLSGYASTSSLKCQVHPRDQRQRPLIKLEPTDHPLAREQRDGITFDRLLDIYAAHGHDIRGAL